MDISKERLQEIRNGGSNQNLSGLDLSNAYLSDADLSGANLHEADLRRADLSDTDLINAYLSGANLHEANLRRADLSEADLSHADLSGADLSSANLSEADLSGAKGLLNPLDWMNSNFKEGTNYYIVYKAIGNTFEDPPSHWKIEEGSFIEEIVNRNSTDECGCGVNFGTLEWIADNIEDPDSIWECRLYFKDLINTVVPYNTDGRARCSRLQLIKVIEEN
jgi:uncharacterized protein YjbI with pentapeptide repeats